MADEILGQRLATLHEDVTEMKTVLKELTRAVNKLALVEQQQGQMAEAMQRAFSTIEKIEGRVAAIELSLPDVASTSKWVDRLLVGTAGAVGMYVLKKTGLL